MNSNQSNQSQKQQPTPDTGDASSKQAKSPSKTANQQDSPGKEHVDTEHPHEPKTPVAKPSPGK